MTRPHNWKPRNVHGRVGVKQSPPSPGVVAYQAKRRATRPSRPVVAPPKRSFVEEARLFRERDRHERGAKRLVRSTGLTRMPHETWGQAWDRHMKAAAMSKQITDEIAAKLAGEAPKDEPGVDEPEALTDEVIGVKEVAEILGKGESWVKEHAVELGGEKHRLRWHFLRSTIEERARA